MDKLRHFLFRSWFTLETFEDRIYHIVLDVAAFVSLISVVTGLLQGLPPISIWVTAGVLLYLIVLRFVTMRFPKYADVCRVLLVLGVNLVLFPLQFFASGGIYSGMILFFLIGIGLTAMLLRGRTAMLVGLLSVAVMAASIILSVHFPDLTQRMTVFQHRDDMIVTLALSGVTLFSIIALMLRAYTQERGQNEQLMERLHDLSVRDGLTGLYNRRELFHRLEEVYGGGDLAGKYIAMFDADGFKALNDAYGHSFGDAVLVSAAGVLREMIDPEQGELTARYGGEEFVSLLCAASPAEARCRVELARERIAALHWDEHPEVRVSISGGLIACAGQPDLTRAMHDVDELLYRAKAAGKNRVCTPEK